MRKLSYFIFVGILGLGGFAEAAPPEALLPKKHFALIDSY